MIYHSRDFFSLLYRASIKALYDSKVKSFEMKNESFLMKEKTKINIANKILSLLRVSRRRIRFFTIPPLFLKICLYSDYQHH